MTDAADRDDGVRIAAAVIDGPGSFFRAGRVVDALIAAGWGPLRKGGDDPEADDVPVEG